LKRRAALQAFGSTGCASYLVLRIVGLCVFNSTGPIAASRHVHIPNSVSFLDDAVVKRKVCFAFNVAAERRTLPSVFGLLARKVGRNPRTFLSLQGMSVIVREVK
jgi:hypothetical protein